jgi:hypothetical protein
MVNPYQKNQVMLNPYQKNQVMLNPYQKNQVMVNETKTCDSIKYDDDGERIVMLFGVNIAKKPTKVDDTIKISNNSMEDINYIHDDDDKNENSILEQGNENENNNNSMSNNEKMKKGMFVNIIYKAC